MNLIALAVDAVAVLPENQLNVGSGRGQSLRAKHIPLADGAGKRDDMLADALRDCRRGAIHGVRCEDIEILRNPSVEGDIMPPELGLRRSNSNCRSRKRVKVLEIITLELKRTGIFRPCGSSISRSGETKRVRALSVARSGP